MKNITNHRAALIHASIAGVATPILWGLLFGIMLAVLEMYPSVMIPPFVEELVFIAMLIVGIVTGAKYSANYLKGTYELTNRNTLISRSTLYTAIVWIVLSVPWWFNGALTANIIAWEMITTLILIGVFYLASKKWLG